MRNISSALLWWHSKSIRQGMIKKYFYLVGLGFLLLFIYERGFLLFYFSGLFRKPQECSLEAFFLEPQVHS